MAAMSDPGTPTLTVDELLLRPWRAADAPALISACDDLEIARWAGTPLPFGPDEAAACLDEAAALRTAAAGAPFAIVDAATRELLGAITRFGPDGPDGHRATLGCWVATAARSRGVGTRAVVAVTDWTFATTAVIRVEGFILAGNAASQRMVERAGFTREGLLRAWELRPDGVPQDVVSWARLRDDP